MECNSDGNAPRRDVLDSGLPLLRAYTIMNTTIALARVKRGIKAEARCDLQFLSPANATLGWHSLLGQYDSGKQSNGTEDWGL